MRRAGSKPVVSLLAFVPFERDETLSIAIVLCHVYDIREYEPTIQPFFEPRAIVLVTMAGIMDHLIVSWWF